MSKIITEEDLRKTISSVLKEYFDKHSRYNHVSLVDDPKVRSGKDWAKYGGNFPVKRNGKIFYVSRSVSVSLYVYCLNSEGEWCVLANKRGPGAERAIGAWNVPCGFLDYNENAEQGAARECWEECGVKVPDDKIRMQGVNSSNLSGAQNVSMRFAAVLDGTINDYPTSSKNCEPGEVDEVSWIPLSKVGNYVWAFGQKTKVIQQAKTSLGYDNGQIKNDLTFKINALKTEIKNNPYAANLFNDILSELAKEKTV